ncbi:MAG: peptidase M15, partial [Xanthobacteraceae bacterium]
MRPQRFAILAALSGTVVLAGWAVAGLAGHDSPGIEKPDAVPIRESFAFRTAPVNAPQPTAIERTGVSSADVAMADPDPPAPAVLAAAAADAAIVEATSPATSPTPPEAPAVQVATAPTSDPAPQDAPETVATLETLDECLVADICIDQYLWAAYQRTPKLDTIKVPERKKVTVKKNGKTRTVTKTVTKLVDEDFTWKDPKAAEKAGMSLQDYVIGGMDRSFKIKLYHALRALDEAGLKPGITSAFRDDYRQSIAAGLKAANDRSYHGGSFRGGYGHGLAADLVSVKGATRAQRWVSSESLWKWVDAHGKEYGVGRPYLDKDPPHVAPIDGKEYAGHRAANTKHAGSDKKKHNRLVTRDD